MMENDFEKLRDAFSKTIIVPFDDDLSQRVTLEEVQEKQKHIITKLPPKTLIIKLDKFQKKEGFFFNDEKGANKRCDYLIFAEVESEKYLIFIELKLNNNSKCMKETQMKFKSSQCLIIYFQKILSEFYEIEIKNYLKKQVLLVKKNKEKNESNYKIKSIFSTDRITFNRLIGKVK